MMADQMCIRDSFWTIRYLDTEQAVLFDELRQSSIHAVQELPECLISCNLPKNIYEHD